MQIIIPTSYDLPSQIYSIILYLNVNNGYDCPAVKLLKSVIKQNKLQRLDKYLSNLNAESLTISQLANILSLNEDKIRNELELKTPEELELEKLLNTSVKNLGLSLRAQKALVQANIQTVQQLISKTAEEIKALENVGLLTFREINQTLHQHNLSLFDPNAHHPEDDDDFFKETL